MTGPRLSSEQTTADPSGSQQPCRVGTKAALSFPG